jgi:hypothetical protein
MGAVFRNIITLDSRPFADDEDAELRALAAHLHRLGPRSTYQLLREILAGADPYSRLKKYAEIDSAVLKYLGGDKLDQGGER